MPLQDQVVVIPNRRDMEAHTSSHTAMEAPGVAQDTQPFTWQQ